MFSLTKDQEYAIQQAIAHRCVFITGPAGTGKSVLIRHLYYETFPLKKVHLCSSTGISAFNIGGMTVHSFIARLPLKDGHPLWLPISHDDVIIIDEISMLGKTIFEELSDSLQKRFRVSGKPFADLKIIFVGDFAQLPPVDDSFCFQSKYWKYIDQIVELTEIKRQTDLPFVEFLLRIRSGELSLSDRRRLVALSKKPTPQDTVHLYPTNDRARQHNDLALHRLSEEHKSEIVELEAVVSHHDTTEEDSEKFFQSQKARIYKKLHLCVGARVMMTQNLDVEGGWMNGTLATVVDIRNNTGPLTLSESLPDGQKISIKRYESGPLVMVERLSDGQKLVILSNAYARQKYSRCSKCSADDCAHPRSTLYLDVSLEELDRKKPHLIITQLPLILAWGMTIHKSQGLTLPSCVIHLYGRYPASLFYVAISRCVSEEGVVIRSSDSIHFDQIVPEEIVMKKIFGKKEKECACCRESFVGPYKVCPDCSVCPEPYELLPFTAFSKNLSKDKEEYVCQILENSGTGSRYKKFREYLTTIYKVFKQ
jgi:ATP-dependent DNA helicase PIF1